MARAFSNSEYRTRADEGLGVFEILGLLRRSWHWIVGPTLLAALCAAAFVQIVPPRYTAEAKVLLESRDPAFARNPNERGENNQAIDEQAVASQVQVAMSRDIARQAIRALNLVGNEEFDPTGGEVGPVTRVLMMLGLVKNPLAGPPEDRILDAYFDRLLVYPVGKSRILAFEFRSRDAELSAKAANTIAGLYIASLSAAQVDTARYASTWLSSNIDTLRSRVNDAEAKVEAFRVRHGLIGSGGSANQPLSTQQLSELSSQLSQARTIRADLVGRVKVLKDMIKEGRAFEIPDVANNELIRRTVESRITLRAQLALESRTLLPAHPRIKELTAQVVDLEEQIKSAADRIVRTLENDSKIASARVESLQAAVDGQSAVVFKGNGSEIELRALEREAKVQREQLESYLSRYREASARDGENASPADARIVSRAITPETPSFPKKAPTLAVATVLALLLAAGSVVGRHLLASPPTGETSRYHAPVPREEERISADPARLTYPEPSPPTDRRIEPTLAEHPDPSAQLASVVEAWPQLTRSEDQPQKPALPEPEAPAAAEIESESTIFPGPTSETASADPTGAAQGSSAVTDGVAGGGEEAASATAAKDEAGQIAANPISDANVASEEAAYEFGALIARLEAGPDHGGRCVLVVETLRPSTGAAEARMSDSLAQSLCRRGRTLLVEVNGTDAEASDPGLTDIVAGEAVFLDAIQRRPGSRLHTMGPGQTDAELLLEEPEGLAIAFNALAQAYPWVLCRIDASETEGAEALLSAVAASMSSVVIVSDASRDEAQLLALYELAEAAGAGQVLIAQGQTSTESEEAGLGDLSLRLTAA